MDDTTDAAAHHCLPLKIANAHGWEVLSPIGFEAAWDGGPDPGALSIRPDAASPIRAPISVFGHGILTFYLEGIFRTSPGWNLWIGGSPNRAKDAVSPLTGIVESDWSPYTFTMNWQLTRPGHPVRFEALEPFCFIFPVQRDSVEAVTPRFAPMAADPELEKRFLEWQRARDTARGQPASEPSARWQRHYYKGTDVAGAALVEDHRTRLRVKPFEASATPQVPPAAEPTEGGTAAPPASGASDEATRLRAALAKREWLLEAIERQRDLSPKAIRIERRHDLGADEFLEHYYALHRPVILTGEMLDWPAVERWTPDYLKHRLGSRPIEYQGDRQADAKFELNKPDHRRVGPFDAFIDHATRPGTGNDVYVTAGNSAQNLDTLSDLQQDQGEFPKFLDPNGFRPKGMMWIGGAGTFTPMHHDLTNNLIAQVVGRKRIKLVPASDVGRLDNFHHVFSRFSDLEDPTIDLAAEAGLAGARIYDVTLEAGEAMFVPFGWWHQVRSLTFSVTLTFINFRWPNTAHLTYPSELK